MEEKGVENALDGEKAPICGSFFVVLFSETCLPISRFAWIGTVQSKTKPKLD